MRFLAYTVADPCMDEKDIGFCPRCGRELVRGTTPIKTVVHFFNIMKKMTCCGLTKAR